MEYLLQRKAQPLCEGASSLPYGSVTLWVPPAIRLRGWRRLLLQQIFHYPFSIIHYLKMQLAGWRLLRCLTLRQALPRMPDGLL